MILVDTSVWIDLLRDVDSLQTALLRQLLYSGSRIGLGDLMLVELLQGARSDHQADRILRDLPVLVPVQISDARTAPKAGKYFRDLRTRGITVRKTIDTLIATRCIVDGIPLLYSDRDFDPFVEHLGLQSALALS